MGGYVHAPLTSGLDGDELSVLRPGRFIPEERGPYTH
jgi:hypothetical protein